MPTNKYVISEEFIDCSVYKCTHTKHSPKETTEKLSICAFKKKDMKNTAYVSRW